METKEELVEHIKEWIKLDTDISKLRSEIKERNNKKKQLSEKLMETMKKNSIDCFDINGGAIIYKKSVVKTPINAKTLMLSLQDYYKDNAEMAETLATHILNSRGEKIRESIGRKVYK